ncbi:Uncharacterised protein [Acholeplasma oculi]|uniref:Uncharacterized protein n=1 Tax=Acholeplasma oculi TaxID=35623 RepID=A0A061ABX2_9MOLU|nr:hypothetical protein [Acholeplasma oculi]CDR31370.1 hypothetical protein Aocu_12970 [Acholeplasma oculi]SKC39466.1 hypothetical protein SAMN02745122_0730 [Acholeplasma oculi]SUT91794.1 Uncharacterised protein [Acholeplasma oculi]
MEIKKKEVYEAPEIEVVEFSFEDSIAVSGQKNGAAFWEEM